MPPPDYTGFLKVLNDWQTIITGGLAIIAAIIGGRMTYSAGVSKPRRRAKRPTSKSIQ